MKRMKQRINVFDSNGKKEKKSNPEERKYVFMNNSLKD